MSPPMRPPIRQYVRALATKATLETLPEFVSKSVQGWTHDVLARAGYYGWPEPILFIAALPKSGSTWLERLLEAVPGYAHRRIVDPDCCSEQQDVCHSILAGLPRRAYSVVKLHTRYSEHNVQVLSQYGIKPIVLYRDLRDVCVSRYYHVLYSELHRHHALYTELSKEAGLAHCIEHVTAGFPAWIDGWLDYARRYPASCAVVTYEALKASTERVLRDLLRFCGIELPGPAVQGVLRAGSRARFDLQRNLGQRLVRATARKGIVGDWRNHFSPAHVALFKARCGERLIAWGYERSLQW